MPCDANLSNSGCDIDYACVGPSNGSPCIKCTDITVGFRCRCGQYSDIFNCTKCNGSGCATCLDFYALDKNLECVTNFCSAFTYQCADGWKCPVTASDQVNCEPCQAGQTIQCKCGKMLNCQLCTENGLNCSACLQGYELRSGNCLLKKNICDKFGSSSQCNDSYYCNGTFGADCTPCASLKINQYCKCEKKEYQNCTECGVDSCNKCVDNYAVQFGECRINTCGQVQNTLNCAFGHYCKQGSSPNQECVVCNGDQECNCGTLAGCKSCGLEINTCGQCFNGFELQQKKCVRKTNTCGEQLDSSLCLDNFFCNGNFGDQCSPCQELTLYGSCKCNKINIQNCTSCNGGVCDKCLTGFYAINNSCVPNVCISGQPSEVCALNNYCPDNQIGASVSCIECGGIQTAQCNCNGANNCNTCDSTQSKCDKCLKAYVKNGEVCQLDNNICDKNDESTLCDTNTYCNGVFGDKCQNCSGLKQGFSCFCSGNMQLNCTKCNGALCQDCISGYNQVNGICQPNFCDITLSNTMCQSGNICVAGSKQGDSCQPCKENQTVPCNCGVAQNCSVCGLIPNTCGKCLGELVLDQITQSCIKIVPGENNVCDTQQTSNGCFDNYFCNSVFGQACTPCSFIILGKHCNCADTLKENCTFCSEDQCISCIDRYTAIKGECVINTCGGADYRCNIGFYCPENAVENTPCQQCDFANTQECNCGSAKNCQTCSVFVNQCQTCLKGSILVKGQCVAPVHCDRQNPCPNFNFCNNGNCELCDIQNAICQCEDAVNCQKCGLPGSCVMCIHGWKQDNYGNCTIPVCTKPPQVNQYCAAPDQNRQCSGNQIVIDSMIHQCNCGENADGCALCLETGIGCKICMNGLTMMSGKCILTPPDYIGSCDSELGSSLCAVNHGCNGYGQCVACGSMSLMHFCKCEKDKQVENCAECEHDRCGKCLSGSALKNGQCEFQCNSQLDCLEEQMCDSLTKTCQQCDGSQPCRCGTMENCQRCDANGKCDSCLPNYVKDRGNSCSICEEGYYQVHEQPVICQKFENGYDLGMSPMNIIGCVIAGVIIVTTVILIVVRYIRRPKKYTFQHNGFE